MLGYTTTRAQTVVSPKLECVYNHTNGDVFIAWQNKANGCGAFSYYVVYRSNKRMGPYDSIASITNVSADTFLDAGANGNVDTWYYYLKAYYACKNYTIQSSDTFTNAKLPTGRMKVVTVANGRALVEWYGIKDPQIYGYVIYQVTNNGVHFSPLTIVSAADSSYTDTSSRPGLGSYYYTVAVTDSCNNVGDYDINPHHSIFMTDSIDQCARTIKLKWNQYDNWPKGVKKYYVYVGTGSGNPKAVDSFDNPTFTYTYHGVNIGDSLTYYVEASSWNKLRSRSNVISKRIHVFQPVSLLYIKALEVLKDNTVTITFSMDPRSSAEAITVQRSDDGATFNDGAYISVPSSLYQDNTYNDYLINAGQQSYYYRLETKDSCGRVAYSNVARTVFLDGFSLPSLRNDLEWNDYDLSYGHIQFYNLYRSITNDTPWNFVKLFPSGALAFEDAVGKLGSPDGKFCYYLEGFDTVTFPGLFYYLSYTRSNVFCLNQATRVYMPNVYEPTGRNQHLKPFLFFEGGIKTYSFSIYNRYGENIFSTTNPDQYWDGRFAGSIVQQDVYTYLIEVVDENKKTVQRTGTILVLR